MEFKHHLLAGHALTQPDTNPVPRSGLQKTNPY